ncbi:MULTISPECIES: metallophosphoesterase [unclassified Nocardioides]|uniref:metallophosphoesterase n=1 Tax=unclassified Nocardioides TaxID=2615069 RepID=UPI0006F7C260|nr:MULTISPECIES: metallophosphoesterase [unclassified Nocardioides]KRA32453.1 3',5'-cyclic-nucleotide phosphodiesterase [Nocardioides sp. Root614]KRA89106.1 3',5'-cyclic-nucleotide phosphodiesterase [Nocardioides sp. Root682]
MEPLGQYPDPIHVVAHLSDPHLLATSLQYGVVDTAAHLELALARLSRLPMPPQALVFTGDLADKAEPAAYRKLREVVEPAAAALGAEVVWVMGNHDEREAYSRELFGDESDAPQDRVHDIAGLRIVALDTSVPGWHHGELSDDQLVWLADVLAEPAPHGTLLAMHHAPIPVPMLRLAELIELHDQERLAAVVAGSDVRGILGGHFHFTSFSTFAGVPVSVASATCYTSDIAPDQRLLSGVDAHQAFTMLHLYDDRVVHSVVPASDGLEVSGHGLDMLAPFNAMTAAERFDMVSRKDSLLNKPPG